MEFSLIGILGILGNIFAFFLQISPLPTIFKGLKEKEIKNLTLSYFVVALFNSIFWFGFGFNENDKYIYIINGSGIIFFLFYTISKIYVDYLQIYYIIFFIIFYFSFFIFIIKYLSAKTDIFIATIISCLWQCTTIPTMRQSLYKKDASFVNIIVMTVSIINFFIWVLYGIFDNVFLISFVNCICFIFCFFNIYIYIWSLGKIEDDSKLISFLIFIFQSDALGDIDNEKYKRLKESLVER